VKILFPFMFFLLVAWNTLAAPAITCHCFQDRSFEVQSPAAADPYILATTQNSLLAAAFGLSKREVVSAKMAGVPADRLWVVQYLAFRSGLDAGQVEAARQLRGNWASALSTLHLDPATLAPGFVAVLDRGGEENALAAAVVDVTLALRLGAESAVIQRLRAAGADDQETVLALFLERRTGQSGDELFRRVKSGKTTWGEILHASAIEPANIDDEMARLLR